MSDPEIVADAWRRAVEAADEARQAFADTNTLVSQNRAFLAIAVSWQRAALYATAAAAAAEAAAAEAAAAAAAAAASAAAAESSDDGPTDADLRGEVVQG